jgi:glutathione peroxidase
MSKTFFDFTVKDLKGQIFDLTKLKGKPILVVNVASKCGFTPQYKGLETLYEKYKDKGLVILGFPCNQFGGQEPGGANEIQACGLNYGVTFPIMEKIDVNGSNAHPIYEFLKSSKPGLMGIQMIKWNFEKFLIDKNGNVVERWASVSTPESIEPTILKFL